MKPHLTPLHVLFGCKEVYVRLLHRLTDHCACAQVAKHFVYYPLAAQSSQVRRRNTITRLACVLGKMFVMVLLCHSSECGCFLCNT